MQEPSKLAITCVREICNIVMIDDRGVRIVPGESEVSSSMIWEHKAASQAAICFDRSSPHPRRLDRWSRSCNFAHLA